MKYQVIVTAAAKQNLRNANPWPAESTADRLVANPLRPIAGLVPSFKRMTIGRKLDKP